MIKEEWRKLKITYCDECGEKVMYPMYTATYPDVGEVHLCSHWTRACDKKWQDRYYAKIKEQAMEGARMRNQFDYINRYYGLSVRRGTMLKFRGRPCVVTSADGAHLRVRPLDGLGKKRLLLHPTWEVEYVEGGKDAAK